MNTVITIHDAPHAEPYFLGEVLSRLAQHKNVIGADIFVNEREARQPPHNRNPVGWIEYLMNIRYADGGKLTIGALQRGLGERTEFHS